MRRVFTIKVAELIGNPETKEKKLNYKGTTYILKSKEWEEAEKEASTLLKELYPNEVIHIR